MNVTRIKLTALKRPERNVRMHTEKQMKEFERSINMFGQIRPIVVDDDLTILAGNGLFDALTRLGWEEADILQVHGLTENQKKKLMLADNKIYGLGVDDHTTLDVFLAELQDDLDIPGFDEDILRSMVSEASVVTAQIQEYGVLDPTEIQEISAAKERKEQMMAAPPSSTPVQTAQQPAPQPEASKSSSGPEQQEPIQQYVVCPHCGGKVWL